MSQQSHSQTRQRSGVLPPFVDRLVQGLSSRYLVYALGGLFVLDFLTPDPVPLVDEVILGVATLLLARWQSRNRREERQNGEGGFATKPPTKDVTPQP